MITPRRTRLLRAPSLQSFQRAIADLVRTRDPWRAHETAVLVPTRAAAEQLRRTLEELASDADPGSPVLALPLLLTRDEWYGAMHERLGNAVPLLSPVERQVCTLAAAREAVRDHPPPFKLRPGLVPSIVGFYDEIRRCQRSVESFERLLVSELEPSVDLDRGARRLLRQTRFLAETFRSYQRRLSAAGRLDEHELRRLLIRDDASRPFSQIVVTIGDQTVDTAGLWSADFDLLTRLPGLEQIDVVATEAVLAAGFYERLAELLPGMAEERLDGADDQMPVLVAPVSDDDRHHFVWRDREDELVAVIRALKGGATAQGPGVAHGSTDGIDGREAVVFQRPLPYLYLARQLFDQAGVPFDARDGLPLAAEPYAAAVDLVADCVTSGYSRSSVIGLLRSPHFVFEHGGRRVGPLLVERFDQALHDVRYAGGRSSLSRLADECESEHGPRSSALAEAGPAAIVMARLASELEPLDEPAPAAQLLDTLLSFLTRHQVSGTQADSVSERESNARAGILGGLAELAEAHRLLDDTPVEFRELVSSLRRWIESQTFTPPAGIDGVQLVDVQAALYGRFREIFIVGLVDGEWPPRPVRHVLYPASLLVPLGWPRERDRLRATGARFADLRRLPLERLVLSTFSLEDDSVVIPSSFLEEPTDTAHVLMRAKIDTGLCVTLDDALAQASVPPGILQGLPARWLGLRQTRPDGGTPPFHGVVGQRPAATYAVKALEQYLECPFKYFAGTLLGLGDEPADRQTLTPQQRGLLLHRVLETFYTDWQATPGGAMTLANLDQALERFRGVAERALRELPPADRTVVRAWLLGSAAAPGLAERLFLLEISRPGDVVERLVEFRIDGTFVFEKGGRRREARIRGVVDRIDLFSNGTFRLIDYKANRAPDRHLALQLPVYSRCAEQQLEGYREKSWQVGDAAYAAFGAARLHVPLARRDLKRQLARDEGRVVDVLDAIDTGVYPPRPAELYRCNFCPYPTVCRKDYVGEG